MAASRKTKLIVCAYLPAGERYPVLQVAVELPPNRKLGQFTSPVVRRADPGYADLYKVCGGKPRWLYNQSPLPLI
jgi:hypothetical protein